MNRKAMETDVVVIGSGVTGLAAALTEAEGGAKVIVFEKERSLGEPPISSQGCSPWKAPGSG